jgi:hypothetical protein
MTTYLSKCPSELSAWGHTQLLGEVCRHTEQKDVHKTMEKSILLDG